MINANIKQYFVVFFGYSVKMWGWEGQDCGSVGDLSVEIWDPKTVKILWFWRFRKQAGQKNEWLFHWK